MTQGDMTALRSRQAAPSPPIAAAAGRDGAALRDLVVDASCLANQLSGIGYYTLNTLAALVEALPATSFRFFMGSRWSSSLPEIESTSADRGRQWSLRRIASDVPLAPRLWRFYGRLRYAAGVAVNGSDLVYAPNFLPPAPNGTVVPVIHDLSFIRHPETHPKSRVNKLRRIGSLVASAPSIITVSEFSKSEIVDVFAEKPDKIFVAPPGIAAHFRRPPERVINETLRRYQLSPNSYILSLGNLEPRKNLGTLVDAYRGLPDGLRSRFPLVLTGAKGWGDPGLPDSHDALLRSGQLRTLGYLPYDDLPALYAGALVFCYPSIYEGFGMPVAEALACGGAVLASNAASLPEAAGDYGILLEPRDADAWGQAIQRIVDDDRLRTELQRRAPEQARHFDWNRTARVTVEALEHALK